MRLGNARLNRALIEAARELHRLRLWLELDNVDCVALKVPGEPHPLAGTIMGQGGQEYGLSLKRGERACSQLRTMFAEHAHLADLTDPLSLLGYSMDPYRDLPREHRKFYRKAKWSGDPDDLVPFFLVKEPNRIPRDLRRPEAEILLYAIRGIIKARETGLLEPVPITGGDRVLTLTVTGDPLAPDVAAELNSYPDAPVPSTLRLPKVPTNLKKLPRLAACWVVGFPQVPAAIEGEDRALRVLFVLDTDTGKMMGAAPISGGDPGEGADALFALFAGENPEGVRGVPDRLVFGVGKSLFDAVTPVLATIGVHCEYDPDIAVFDEIVEEMFGPDRTPGELVAEQGIDTHLPPEPDDRDGWKRVDERLIGRTLDEIEAAELFLDGRALRRYFGDDETGFDFMENEGDSMAGACLSEWLWLDYRPTKRSKTLAEKMLAKGLPEAVRMLVEAKAGAAQSIYRVEKTDAGTSLTVLDIVTGERVVLHDRTLSQSAQIDWHLPLRVFPVGEFHFAQPLGPVLTALDVADTTDFLEDAGMEFTPQGMREKSHLFGRLWEWNRVRRAAGPPRIQNTDGDELHFQTATYQVTDKRAARKAILKRKDVKEDNEPNTWVWFRDTKSGMPGQITLLGSLRFVGDELLLEVNSHGRLEKARKWLDRIRGIQFEKVSARSGDEMMKSKTPSDDRREPETEMDEEAAEHLRRMLHEHYMAWLDEPIPALGDRTPRQVCKTRKGKARLAMMIRALPQPSGPIEIELPIKDMLRELGIEDA